jgi:hypothetical protein
MAWLTGWSKRVKLTIDHNDISADLTNFPILLYISNSSGRLADNITFIFTELGANKLKIAVTTSDGTMQCYVEIEKWDYTGTPSTSKAWLWVKVPSVSSTVDTDLYLYYDNTHANNTDYVGDPESTPAMNVWDANFKAVYHMRDYDTSHIHDSTGNNYDGTKKAVNEPIVTTSGKIDDAQDFDGTNDYINVGNISPTDFTVEVWFKADALGVATKDFLYKYRAGSTISFDLGHYGGSEAGNVPKLICHIGDATSNDYLIGTTQLSTGIWYHAALTYVTSSKARQLFLNGASDGSDTSAKTISYDTHSVYIGADQDETTHYFDGIIDEFRISNIVRSPAWIKASYESGRDDLLDWGSEETPVITRSVTELLGGYDVKSRIASLYRIKVDYVGLLDSKYKKLSKIFSDYIGLLDIKSTIYGFYRIVTEYMGLLETKYKKLSKVFIDYVGLLDVKFRISILHRTFIEQLGLMDTKIKRLSRIITEKIGLLDVKSILRNLHRIFIEYVGIMESRIIKKSLHKIIVEYLGIKDIYYRFYYKWRRFQHPKQHVEVES